MRKPRPEDYSSRSAQRQPDHVNTDGLVPLAPKPNIFPPPTKNVQSQAELQTSLQASNIASKQASLLAKVSEMGRLKATNAATFRFPPELLEKLEEVEYVFRKEHKRRTTKNAIIVGALAFLLFEYEEKETQSALYQYLMGE